MAKRHNSLISKHDKTSVNYRVGYKCANCIHFMHPRACELVAGSISPEAVCDMFEVQENSKPYDKSFFIKERMNHGK